MNKVKDTLLLFLTLIIIWFACVIIRLENFHYATQVGFCADSQVPVERNECLKNKETRTNPIWHLFYALTD